MAHVVHPDFQRQRHFRPRRQGILRRVLSRYQVIELFVIIDRTGLGYRRYPQEATFTDFTLPLDAKDAFYLTTDGLIDQIGGPRGRSFGKRRFQTLLKRNQGAPMQKQAESLQRSFTKFQGQQLRRDDLTVLGFMPLGRGGIHARARAV